MIVSAKPSDIESHGDCNSEYDQMGNLGTESKEISQRISWTVSGKISSITKDPAEDQNPSNDIIIQYIYDAGGNRIAKTVSQQSTSLLKTTDIRRNGLGTE